MSKKSVRGAGPGLDQAPDPAAPGGGRTPDSGGTPVEPWGGERTDRVSGRETSGPRVALVPAVSGEGRVVDPSSTADTSRMADSGRTTLMGVPSPIVNQSDKPTTSPGHGVHLPAENPRPADARPAVGSGEQEASGKATGGASQDRSGKSPGAAGGAAQEHKEEEDKSLGAGVKEPREGDAGGVVPNERTIAAAAATFRAAAAGASKQPGPEGEREPERSWTADRTQEFRLEPPAAAPSAFAKTLVTGMAIAAGTGILVAGFIHSRLHGGAAEQSELARSPGPPAMAPVPLPPPPLPDNPVPPAAGEPTNVPTVPANAGASEATNAANAPTMVAPQPEAPAGEAAPALPEANRAAVPEANQGADNAGDAGKVERRLAARPRTPAAPGRTAPLPRTPRVPPSTARPGVTPFPGAPPSPAAQAPAATSPPTTPPPLTTPPPIDRPVAKPDLPRTEGKPYDPDMPLPPTME